MNKSGDLKKVVQVIEATPIELNELLIGYDSLPPYLYHYGQALSGYLICDIQKANAALKAFEELKDSKLDIVSLLKTLVQTRIKIRNRTVSETEAHALRDHPLTDEIWKGETFFVMALVWEVLGDHAKARDHYLLAAQELRKIGAHRKSIKAILNYVACESRVHPEKKLINDYFFVYRQARKLKERPVAGVALLNISREYQKIGALLIALRFCERALECHSSAIGTLPYFLAIAHRCHLLFQLNRYKKAYLDYELCMASDHPEVKAALAIIDHFISENRYKRSVTSEEEALLTFTWRERLLADERQATGLLGELEQRLVAFLSDTPKGKFEIMDHLYGAKIDLMSRENRFKVLLSRLRKKCPNLIEFVNGKYELVDPAFLSGTQRKDAS